MGLWDTLTHGPLNPRQQPMDQFSSTPMDPPNYTAQGFRAGARAGPVGAAAGAVVGGIYGWLAGRGYVGQRIDPNGPNMGPPSDMAGIAPDTSQNYGSDYSIDPNAGSMGPPSQGPAWYSDTTMQGADPMGLVPDYNQGGGAPLSHQDLQDYRDGTSSVGPGGISNFKVGGQNVIMGGNGFDANGRYMFNQNDQGG